MKFKAIFIAVLTSSYAMTSSGDEATKEALVADLLAQNYPAEVHLPEHENGVAVCVWNDEGVVYTTSGEDPRVDDECQPILTPQQQMEIARLFPD